MAETRAVNRALRKAYGIGLCSLEELPPWATEPEQIPELRRSLQSRPPFQKGVPHANQNPRPQPANGTKPPDRRPYGPAWFASDPPGTPLSPAWQPTFLILEPAPYAGRYVRTRLYCHDRALWKLRWFFHDFNYDAELLAADELDDRRVVGLEGVIRSGMGKDGHRCLDVQGFAPSERWGEMSV